MRFDRPDGHALHFRSSPVVPGWAVSRDEVHRRWTATTTAEPGGVITLAHRDPRELERMCAAAMSQRLVIGREP